MEDNVNVQDVSTLEDQLKKQKLEEKKEFKKLRSTANYIGLAMFMFFALSSIILFIPNLLRQYGAYNPNLYGQEFSNIKPEVYFLIYGSVFIVSLFVPFFFVVKLCGGSLSKIICFEKVGKDHIFSYVGIGLAVCGIMNYFVELLSNLLNSNGIYPKISSTPYDNSPLSIVLYLIIVSLLPALIEEFAFRGVILGTLKKYGNAFAIVTSAILFGLIHGNIYQTPFAFVGGLFFGYLVIKTNSLLPGMIIHFINNLSCSIIIVISKNSSIADGTLENIVNITFIILGIISLIYLIKQKGKNAFEISKSLPPISLSRRVRAFYLSPLIVIFIIFIAMAIGVSLV